MHTANVGDSRALLCRKSTIIPLTTDHSPERADEKKRVEAEGGVIVSNSLGEPLVNACVLLHVGVRGSQSHNQREAVGRNLRSI